MPFSENQKRAFSEQDTADKLILPYLSQNLSLPRADSLDYQAQHTIPTEEEHSGRYDGLFLHGGYPYVLLEAKKYAHDLNDNDYDQARRYSVSEYFEVPVTFMIISNGRQYNFYKKSSELDQSDHKVKYEQITEIHWDQIIDESPGRISILLTSEQLLQKLIDMKELVYRDINSLFYDLEQNKYDLNKYIPLKDALNNIIQERKIYIGTTSSPQRQIKFAIQTIALHFILKILFIKIIEDLSSGIDTPRIIHTLFPKEEYNQMGGVFGYKVLNALKNNQIKSALRIFAQSKKFYKKLGKDIAKITYEDIFRYGFNIHMTKYGKILKAKNYDKFFPSSDTLQQIRQELIEIDIRNAIVFASSERRKNVIGDIYAKLIDKELRDSIGAIYTPDDTVDFMINLAHEFLGRFRGHKIVENACGSGHFYRQIYRIYVDEVAKDYKDAGHEPNYHQAHSEALEHVFGRDIDPFAIQLTLLGVFLEQLKDNVKAISLHEATNKQLWKANFYIDPQNSLDPITINPDYYFDIYKNLELETPKSLIKSCKRSLNPDLIIGNPPYGVSVDEGPHYSDIYDLQSNDSYGYFISNAIDRLSDGKSVIFITSSSFLTIKSHFDLRKKILDNCKIIRIVKLSRSTFPGIDIFPVIIELEKCSNEQDRLQHFYQYYDFWQLHPIEYRDELISNYNSILNDLSASNLWPNNYKRVARYKNRQGIINIYSKKTIFDGIPSLFEFMSDYEKVTDPTITLYNTESERYNEFNIKNINGVNIIKLGKIAYSKQGLIPPSTREYYRISKGVRGGAVSGGYIEVDINLALSLEETDQLSIDEKEHGININDPSNEKHYVPLDKAGQSDIEAQILSQYYRPVEYYVNWSRSAVDQMKTHERGRFQNAIFYFKKGISYSDTGIYSPTFRLSHGGVFDQKGSLIYSEYLSREFLLGLLCSKLIKYFVKVFINHSVSSQVDSIKDIPIAIPSVSQQSEIENKVNEIFEQQKLNSNYDYYEKQLDIDQLVYSLYRLNQNQIQEVENWYDRRYPKLRRDFDSSQIEEH